MSAMVPKTESRYPVTGVVLQASALGNATGGVGSASRYPGVTPILRAKGIIAHNDQKSWAKSWALNLFTRKPVVGVVQQHPTLGTTTEREDSHYHSGLPGVGSILPVEGITTECDRFIFYYLV